jgi:hypothetical protein
MQKPPMLQMAVSGLFPSDVTIPLQNGEVHTNAPTFFFLLQFIQKTDSMTKKTRTF